MKEIVFNPIPHDEQIIVRMRGMNGSCPDVLVRATTTSMEVRHDNGQEGCSMGVDIVDVRSLLRCSGNGTRLPADLTGSRS